MELTNNAGLPQALVDAVTNDPYYQPGHISVTGLIQPPRIRQLTFRYQDKISIDASDGIWMLVGSNVHAIIERADQKDALQEERLSIKVNGWTVTGATDLYDDAVITDFKTTSVWSVLHGVKKDWEIQLNLYAELWRSNKWPVDKLQIIAILRDWSKHQVWKSKDYPRHQVVVLPVELWKPVDAHEYITERVTLHQESESMSDEDLPLCTADERWDRPTKYAVIVIGQKRAKRVLDTMEEAEEWADVNMKKKYHIEVRPGESVRCESYCDCNNYCSYYQKLKEGDNGKL